jgi:KDO2-lipid IV(A) lauroyltransferase
MPFAVFPLFFYLPAIMVFLFQILSRLSLRWLHRLGALAGWIVYLVSPRYRHNLNANLAQAGLDAKLRWPAAAEAGKQALEVAYLWMRSAQEANAKVIEIVGQEHLEAARAKGKGILFLTPHLGCFEIIGQYLSTLDEVTILYRVPRQKSLQKMMLAGRQREHLRLAPANFSGVRVLIKALKKGKSVGILPDQAPGAGEGAWLDFFGRPAYTMTLAARLSETGATALMVWGERLPKGRGYRLHFHPPSQELTGDTLARAQQINCEIEALIRQCPTQYLWGYNRYKGEKRITNA